MDDWWRRQDPSRTPRFDLFAAPGCATAFAALDISRVSLRSDTAFYEPVAGRFGKIVGKISASSPNPAKKYLVYDRDRTLSATFRRR